MELRLPANREAADAAGILGAKTKGAEPTASVERTTVVRPSGLPSRPTLPSSVQVKETQKQRVRSLFQLACKAESLGRFAEAQNLLRQCLELDLSDARSWLMLARIEANVSLGHDVPASDSAIGDEGVDKLLAAHERARGIYRQGLLHCPDSVHLMHAWAVFESRAGNMEIASELFRRGLELDPQNAYIYHSWGLMEQRSGCQEKARKLFQDGALRCLNNPLCVAWAELEASDGHMTLARCIFELGLALVLDDFEDTSVNREPESDVREHMDVKSPQLPYATLRDLVRKIRQEGSMKLDASALTESSHEESSKRARSHRMADRALSAASSDAVLFAVLGDRLRWREDPVKPGRIQVRLHGQSKRLKHDRFALAAETAIRYAETEKVYGSVARTRELLQWALDLDPTNANVLLSCARLDAQRGAITRARSLFRAAESALGQSPTTRDADQIPSRQSRRQGVYLYVAWATMEMEENMLAEANAVLERGNRHFPNCQVLYQTWGLVRDRQGDCESARTLFARSVRYQPNAPAYVAWALLEERLGLYERARELFEAALKVDPGHGPAYNAYGRMEARLGNLEQSRQIFMRGLAAQHSPCIYHGYAIAELRYGDGAARAEEILRQGVARKGSESVFLWHTLGAVALKQRRYEDARAIFAESLEIYPTNSRLLVGAALSETALGTSDSMKQARALFRRAVLADPLHGHAWQSWGVFETRQGNLDAARVLFERGLERCPRHASLWQAYGLLESTAGNTAKARALFEHGASLGGDHVHLLNAHACLEARQGDYRKASALLQRAIQIDPHHGASWNAYALLEMRNAHNEKARRLLEQGLRNDATHVPLYRTYARLEMECQNWENAHILLAQGLAADPQDSRLAQLLVELEKRSGMSMDAALRSHRSRLSRSQMPHGSESASIRVDLPDGAFAVIDLDQPRAASSSAESMEEALEGI
jgi:tetratricopeptide (TPR) repeat protein